MLILTRKLGEKIIINHNTILTVEKIFEKCVQLKFEAPASVPIWRMEIHKRMVKERLIAALEQNGENNE